MRGKKKSPGLRHYLIIMYIILGVVLIATIFPIMNISVTHMEEKLISSRLSADINYIEDLIGEGDWNMRDGSICRGDVVVGDGTQAKANLEPFLQHEKKTGTFAYVFIKCGDEGLTYVDSTPTQAGYQQGHFLRAAGSTKDPNGNSIVGTYMDKKVADILDAEDVYDGEANVAGGMIYCRYETLKNKAGDVIGAIVVGRGINELKAQISRTIRTVIYAGIAAMIIGIILIYLIMNRWIVAMRKSTSFLEEIEKGDIPKDRLKSQGLKEVDILNQGINSLADTLTENEELRIRSETDQITGLSNRFGLNRRGGEMMDHCTREGLPISIGVIDIDYFKHYNDNYGHQKGDECIAQIGEILRSVEEPGKIIAGRYGGDEFIVIAREMSEYDVEKLAERIRTLVRAADIPHAYSKVSSSITLSQGHFISIPEEGHTLSDYLTIADKVMYEVKNGSKDGYSISMDKSFPADDEEQEKDPSRPDKIEWGTYHDYLTQTLSREGFFREVAHILEENPEEEYYMVSSNIRDFKLVNQFFGYERGNRVLIETANMLRANCPDIAAVGRIHGDHFSFLIPREKYDEEKLRKIFSDQSRMIDESAYTLRYHIGVYPIQDKSMDVSIMCDRANIAMTSINSEANFAISYYDDNMMEHLLRENTIIAEFENALASNQFNVFLQPIVDGNEKVMGAEALVRWIRDEGDTIIQPGEFIEVLEKAGLIHKLDLYVWEESAKLLKKWKGTPMEDLFISVNISPQDINYIDIEQAFIDLTEKYGILREQLNPEFTETALISDTSRYIELVSALREDGFYVEIDDFGTGYSSLNMLRGIHADVLKIDKDFLGQTERSDRNRIILASILEMARNLDMKVVAEGVENEYQFKTLSNMGCDMFQGFLFSKPVPWEEFEKDHLSSRA